jgi:uncharacterized protein (DUF779 family)
MRIATPRRQLCYIEETDFLVGENDFDVGVCSADQFFVATTTENNKK